MMKFVMIVKELGIRNLFDTPVISHSTIQRRGDSSGLQYLKKTAQFFTGEFS